MLYCFARVKSIFYSKGRSLSRGLHCDRRDKTLRSFENTREMCGSWEILTRVAESVYPCYLLQNLTWLLDVRRDNDYCRTKSENWISIYAMNVSTANCVNIVPAIHIAWKANVFNSLLIVHLVQLHYWWFCIDCKNLKYRAVRLVGLVRDLLLNYAHNHHLGSINQSITYCLIWQLQIKISS